MPVKDIWFRYWDYKGGVRAAPVTWQGWVSLLGSLAAWLALGAATSRWAATQIEPFLAMMAGALIVFTGATGTAVALVIYKGRKA